MTEPRELPEPNIYKDMNDVPDPWRSLRGARLTLEQVNWIIQRAYQTGSFSTAADDSHEPVFVPNYGGAREELLDSHEEQRGWLVPKKGEA